MKKTPVISIILIVMIGVTGCGEKISVDSYVSTALAGTAAIETMIAEKAAATVAAIPTETLTPTPTITPTLTPIPPVTATVMLNAYCRPGPGVIYGQGKLLHSGESVMVVGRLDDAATWLQVQPEGDSDNCWVTSEALAITGETDWVEMILAPPTPTAIPDWNGKWTVWFGGFTKSTFHIEDVSFTQTGNEVSAQITYIHPSLPWLPQTYFIQGSVSGYGKIITGTASNSQAIHNIYLVRDAVDPRIFRGKFTGNAGTVTEFCGTMTPNGSKPNPCLP